MFEDYGECNGRNIYDVDSVESWEQEQESRAYGPRPIDRVTCKFCGKENLVWKKFEKGWRLADCSLSHPHRCERKP